MSRIKHNQSILYNIAKLIQTLTFAGLDALGPCVIKISVPDISAAFEPCTAASATTTFARFFGSATLGACGTSQCWHRHTKRGRGA